MEEEGGYSEPVLEIFGGEGGGRNGKVYCTSEDIKEGAVHVDVFVVIVAFAVAAWHVEGVTVVDASASLIYVVVVSVVGVVSVLSLSVCVSPVGVTPSLHRRYSRHSSRRRHCRHCHCVAATSRPIVVVLP